MDIHLVIINNINEIPISHTHFSIIIGNLLENAIENCGESKEIIIDIGNMSTYFYIKIINSIDTSILDNNPHLLTTKHDKKIHGIGLNNIYFILNKYSGKISFNDQDNHFIVRILIPT